MPCTMRAIGLVGNVGKLLFAETEEIEIGGVAEIEKLEMILPSLVAKLDRTVVVLQELVGVVQAAAFEDPFLRHHVGKRFKLDRLQVVDDLANFDVPIFKQLVPILEIESGAFEEKRHAFRDFVRRNRNRIHVEVAVVNAVIDAIGRRHHQMSGVVLAQALARIVHHDGVERPKRRRPVLRIAEPKSFFLACLQFVLEQAVIGIKLAPTLGSRRSFQARKDLGNVPARS